MIERQKICEACEHRVMKAGFRFPRCRYPGSDFRLGPENTDDPARACPAGQWPQTRFQDKRALQAKIAAKGAMTIEYNRRAKICDTCEDIMPNGAPCALGKGCPTCRRRSLYKPNMICPADPPKWGPVKPPAKPAAKPKAVQPEPPPDERIRVVWTISAWNESLLSDTVRELYDSVADPHIDFDVLVVDDGSTDGCADDLPCKVLRNPKPLGIGYNLNLAADYAISEMGADVIGVADSHMRIPKGAVETLAHRALEERCVLCSASRGYKDDSKTYAFGAYLCFRRTDCVAAKWIGEKWPKQDDGLHRPAEEWAQVQVPLGAFYAYSAATVKALKTPTGRLWETVVGRWGFLLEPFSLKCLLMGIPVYVSRDVFARHLYRSSNPCPASHQEKVYNGAFGFSSVLSEETFENYRRPNFAGFHTWAITRGAVDKQKVDRMVSAGREGVKRSWTPAQEKEILDSLPILDHKDGKHEANPVPLEALWLPGKTVAVSAQ